MNKLIKLFKTQQKNVLSIYFTAGFPELESTSEIILGSQEGAFHR